MPIRRRLLTPVLAAACLVVLAVAAGIVWVRLPHSPGGRSPVPFASLPASPSLTGRTAPDFTLPVLWEPGSGSPPSRGGRPAGPPRTLSLHDLRGKPVVLNFWASWCVPCREETPLLIRLHKVYSRRGVAFVGVNTQDEAPAARRFLAQYQADYPVVISSDDRLMVTYGILGLPTTIFIDADGMVRSREAGGFVGPEGEKALISHLDRLLRSSP